MKTLPLLGLAAALPLAAQGTLDSPSFGGSRVFSEGVHSFGNPARFDRCLPGYYFGYQDGDLKAKGNAAALDEADVIVVMIDALSGITDEDARVFDRIKDAQKHRNRPVILAINKSDIANKPRILPLMERCIKLKLFSEIIPLSALTGDQLDVLIKAVIPHLPEGPRWYEPHQKTDQSRDQLIAEFIREQVLLATHEEVPHAVAVMLDKVEEREKVTAIYATVIVERPGQKAIVIGKGGSMMKHIGTQSRQELERLLGRKVFLELWVKVSEGWRSDERMIRQFGYSGGSEGN